MSKLYWRYGAMNSGKSTALIQVAFNYEERGQTVLIVKPGVDTKHEGVLSRIGNTRQVDILVGHDTDLYESVSSKLEHAPVHCILVDEAQFLEPHHVDELFRIAVQKGVPVIAYGLRTDFQSHFFPGSLRLMELAHSIEEMKTICRCGRKAIFNGRQQNGSFVKSGGQVAIDGEMVTYESLCGKCYIEHVALPTAKVSS
jgi:thymidine kinase